MSAEQVASSPQPEEGQIMADAPSPYDTPTRVTEVR